MSIEWSVVGRSRRVVLSSKPAPGSTAARMIEGSGMRLEWREVGSWTEEAHDDPTGDCCVCHCGELVVVYDDGFTRGLCERCSSIRCDTGVNCNV